MIRLSYRPLGSDERSVALDREVIRFGSDPKLELCVSDGGADQVAGHHGEFVREGEAYFLVARHPLWVDGQPVRRSALKGGERIRLGSLDGPEIQVARLSSGVSLGEEEDDDTTVVARRLEEHEPGEKFTEVPRLPSLREDEEEPAPLEATSTLMRAVHFLREPHAEVQQWLARAEAEIRKARTGTEGLSSGKTMIIMAGALAGIRHTAEGRAQRWRRKLVVVAAASALAVLALSVTVWIQQRRILSLIAEKAAIDAQIQAVFDAMADETDEEKLSELEARLQLLMGDAAEKIIQVSRRSSQSAEELAQPRDELDRDIRRILRSFRAETYAIPPIFRSALQRHVQELQTSPNLRAAYARKRRYWRDIQQALRQKQLPAELGYIAYAESGFDPSALNTRSGAAGMWQLMEQVARPCGLDITPNADARFDPSRSSEAAACHLSNLMVEFGEQSFMLALASYNRGENGVRRALHKVAREPGGYRRRDFWHLYRLKLLPEETREYVPKVLAAAIVLGNPSKFGLDAGNN